MPKYMIVVEVDDKWDALTGYRDFFNSVEAAIDAAREIAAKHKNIAVAEVVKRFTAEVSIREVKVK